MAVPLTFNFINPNTPSVVEKALREILLEKILSVQQTGKLPATR